MSWRYAVRAEFDAVEEGPLGPWLRGPAARLLSAAQPTAGVPMVARGVRRRSGGWAVAGAVLIVHGALGPVYDRVRGHPG
ncbi:hypothetical protein [Streptomyces sp. NBC_00885]|uniref:hypothetical protein n=1 Tax=Streptomyces sp. NBC_00885 TaxID=2975857 RepID=UPI00386374F3